MCLGIMSNLMSIPRLSEKGSCNVELWGCAPGDNTHYAHASDFVNTSDFPARWGIARYLRNLISNKCTSSAGLFATHGSMVGKDIESGGHRISFF